MKRLLTQLVVAALFMVLFTVGLSAQKSISGNVSDAADSEPLIGANIIVTGTSQGTITDFDGNYVLNVPEGSNSITISYAGYADQVVDITTGNTFNIALSAGELLDEVVVVGYGSLNAKEVTSSVASVKAENFGKGNISDPAQLLQGKVAGLSITRNGGNPNANVNIRLRGLSTVGANTEPLVIIDGVPGASLQSVDPNDIESIDVLKDGSASAIYGTRGASGVILITTKKGSSDQFKVDYNGFVTMDNPTNFVDVTDAAGYREIINQTGFGNDLGTETDWFEELTRTAWSQTHNVSISGGTKSSSYRASLNYRDNDGVAINTGFNQFNGRLNLNQRAFNDKLNLNLNLAITNRTENDILPETFAYATVANPTQPVFDSNTPQYGGYYEQILFDYYNPISIANQSFIDRTKKRNLISGKAEYAITDEWAIGTFYSQQKDDDFSGGYMNTSQLYVSNGRGLAGTLQEENTQELFEVTTNYTVDLDNNNVLKLLGGYSYQDFSYYGQFAQGGGFITDEFTYNNIFAASDFANGLGTTANTRNSNKIIGFFGRASMSFDDTYFLTANYRHEGSSKFGPNNKWGDFYGFSGGVNIANLIDTDAFSSLKLRAGYGKTGNTPNDSYLSFLGIGPTGANFYNNGTYVASFGPSRNANPNLKWEEKNDFGVGLDFVSSNYKFRGTIEYYNTKTTDLILPFEVPVPPNVASTTFVNVGDLRNSGLEFVLGYDGIGNSNFSWSPSITATYYIDVKLESLSDETSGLDFGGVQDRANLGSPGQNGTPLVRIQEGESLGQILGLDFLGYTDDGSDIVYVDHDGDGALDDQSDRTIIGDAIPTFDLGWSNNMTFGKNWSASFTIRATLGHDLVNANRAFYEAPLAASSYNVLATTLENAAEYTGDPKFSSLHVESGSFLRFDNFEVGYNIPVAEGSPFSNARIYLAGNNLFTITSYSGVDPEVRWTDVGERSVNGGLSPNPLTGLNVNALPAADPLSPGIDRRGTYFQTRSFSFGVNLSF